MLDYRPSNHRRHDIRPIAYYSQNNASPIPLPILLPLLPTQSKSSDHRGNPYYHSWRLFSR